MNAPKPEVDGVKADSDSKDRYIDDARLCVKYRERWYSILINMSEFKINNVWSNAHATMTSLICGCAN